MVDISQDEICFVTDIGNKLKDVVVNKANILINMNETTQILEQGNILRTDKL